MSRLKYHIRHVPDPMLDRSGEKRSRPLCKIEYHGPQYCRRENGRYYDERGKEIERGKVCKKCRTLILDCY